MLWNRFFKYAQIAQLAPILVYMEQIYISELVNSYLVKPLYVKLMLRVKRQKGKCEKGKKTMERGKGKGSRIMAYLNILHEVGIATGQLA